MIIQTTADLQVRTIYLDIKVPKLLKKLVIQATKDTTVLYKYQYPGIKSIGSLNFPNFHVFGGKKLGQGFT